MKNRDKKQVKGTDCVEREAVKKILQNGGYKTDMIREIDSLPSVPAPEQRRSDVEIEKAIEKLDEYARERHREGLDLDEACCYEEGSDMMNYARDTQKQADLLRWALNQKQDTWTDEELLGKDFKTGKAKPKGGNR